MKKMLMSFLKLFTCAVLFTCISGIAMMETPVQAGIGDEIFVSTAGNDDNDGYSWDTAKLTIKAGIETINGGGTLYIASGTYAGEKNRNISVNKDMTIKGQNNTNINGDNSDRIFSVGSGSNVTIENIKFTNGTSNYGGAIYIGGNLRLEGCTITDSTATVNGGAIYNNGNLTINDSTFTNNTATEFGGGGAIYNVHTNMVVTSSIFTNNSAYYGGVIYNANVLSRLEGCTFHNNTAQFGGAVYNGSILTVNNCIFTGNTASKSSSAKGGAIYIDYGGEIEITGSSFENNAALRNGGAVYNSGSAIVHFSLFVGNTVQAVYLGDGSINAVNNWWGANNGPGGVGHGSGDAVSADVSYNPWLKLDINANPASIVIGSAATSIITADLTKNSAGQDISAQGYILDGTEIVFSTDKGTIGSTIITKTTTGGKATAILTSGNLVETAAVCAKAPGHETQSRVCTAVDFAAGRTYQVDSSTGTGTIYIYSGLGNIIDLTALAEGTLPSSGKPAGATFLHGLISLNIVDIAPGSTVILTITYPGNIPSGTPYWKCQNGIWVDCTPLINHNNGDSVLTLTLTDGGPGDADGLVNGVIVDPGGPAFHLSPSQTQSSIKYPSSSTEMTERYVTSPAKLTVKYLNVQPQQARANQPVTVYASMANSGDKPGGYTAIFKINGKVEKTVSGTVNALGAAPLKFEVLPDRPGIYNVDVNGQQAYFTVVGQRDTGNTAKTIALIITILGISGIIVALFMLLKRRLNSDR